MGKGRKERIVFFHRKAAKALRAYLAKRPRSAEGSGEYVFLAANGDRLSKTRLSMIVSEAKERAGLPGRVTPHTLRHTYATHMVEGGADLVSVAVLLGHADLSTLRVYVHLSQTHLRRAHALHPRNQKPSPPNPGQGVTL